MFDRHLSYFTQVILCFTVLVFGLSSCSSKDDKAEALKPAELVDFEASAKLKRVWSVSAGKGQDKRYSKFVPKILGNNIYVADVKGNVFAYNKISGKRLWKKKIDARVSGAIGGAGTVLLLGTYDAELIALSILDGQEVWRSKASSEILAPPAANQSVAIVQTIDGRVFGYDIETGKELWSYDHSTPVLSLRGTASPVVAGAQAVIAFDNGQIISLNAKDGALIWDSRISQPTGRTELERIVDIDGTPLVEGAIVYAANVHGNVTAIARAKGRILWKQEASTHNNLVVAGGKVFVSADDSSLMAVDSGNGALLWSNKSLLRRNIGSPAVIGDYLTVIDDKGYLHLMKQDDGEFAYRFKPKGDGFRSPVLSDDNRIIVLSDDGKLSAYELK